MKWLDHITGGYSSSAKVANNTLVLSLPNALSPIVWRMDLSTVKSSAFEIHNEDGQYLLVMKTPKGDPQKIAPFDNKNSAMKALMAASHALEQAQSFSSSDQNNSGLLVSSPSVKKGKTGQFLTALIGIIILVILIFVLIQTGPRTADSIGGAKQTGLSGTQSGGHQGTAAGVPLSADEFLKNR